MMLNRCSLLIVLPVPRDLSAYLVYVAAGYLHHWSAHPQKLYSLSLARYKSTVGSILT